MCGIISYMDRFTGFVKDNRDVLFSFLGSKMLFVCALIITRTSFTSVLSLFDAVHYRNIAQMGYYVDGITVFFPVIPLIIRFTGDIGLVIINQIAYLASLFFMKKLFERMKTHTKTSWLLAVVAVSPLALFTSIEYTEALFLFFTVASFYLFVERKYPWLMGILLGLAVATRNTGSLLFFAVFIGMMIMFIQDKDKVKRAGEILMCYIPATAISIIYPVFLQIRFGNWKVFMDAQYTYWIRIPSNIIKTTFISLKVIFTNEYMFDGMPDTLILFKINEILSTLLLITVAALAAREIVLMKRARRINIPSVVAVIYSVLFVTALGMTIRDPQIDCPTDSFYRYYFSLFPLFLGIGRCREKVVQISMIAVLLITMLTAPLFCMESFFF